MEIDFLTEYLSLTEDTESPQQFHKWTALSAIASAMQRKITFKLGKMPVYPNLYVMLVADAGVRKGTAMSLGAKLLRSLGIKLAANSGSREALMDKLEKSVQTIALDDNTTEQHNSLTAHIPEIATLFRKNDTDFVNFLLEIFDSNRYEHSTRGMGDTIIERPFLNLIGACTPMHLKTHLSREVMETGLASRFVFIYAESADAKIIPIPNLNTPNYEQRVEALEHKLAQILDIAGTMGATQGFLDAYVAWRYDMEEKRIFTGTKLESYHNRRTVHLMSLAMICCMCRPELDMTLNIYDFERAWGLLDEAEGKMFGLFDQLQEGTGGKNNQAILEALAGNYYKESEGIELSALMGSMLSCMSGRDFKDAFTMLHESEMIVQKVIEGKGRVWLKSKPSVNTVVRSERSTEVRIKPIASTVLKTVETLESGSMSGSTLIL